MLYEHFSILYLARKVLRLYAGVVMLVGCIAVVNAQTAPTETRARVAPVTNGASSPDDPYVQTTTSDVVSNPQPAVTPNSDSPGPPKSTKDQAKQDRVGLLRSQILDAKTEVERVRLQRTLVDYLIALGRPDEAATELRSMLSAEKLDAASYYNIANGLARLGDYEQSIVAYLKAIDARQGSYPHALNNMAVVLLYVGRLDEAYDALVLAIKQQNFRYAAASYNLGIVYAKRGEADLAISEWTRALTVQPDYIDAAVGLARAYAATGQPGLGLEVIDRTLKRVGPNERLEELREEIAAKVSSKVLSTDYTDCTD